MILVHRFEDAVEEASAKLTLSDKIESSDVEEATGLMESCMKKFGLGVDIDTVETGKPRSRWDLAKTLEGIIIELCRRHVKKNKPSFLNVGDPTYHLVA